MSTETTLSPTQQFPDALKYPMGPQTPVGNQTPDQLVLRLNRLFDKIKPLLGCNARKGERVHLRKQQGYYFCSKDLSATLLFPTTHDLEGVSRYHWEDRGGGLQYGWLTDAAKADAAKADAAKETVDAQ